MRKKWMSISYLVTVFIFLLTFPCLGISKILVKGGPIHGANGIAFSDDDKLYVGSINGGEILVLEEKKKKVNKAGKNKHKSKKTWKIVDILGYSDGVEAPDDLVFAADGTFYVAMPYVGAIARFSADGQMIASQYVGPGVNPITVSDDGRLFAGLTFYDDALFEVDPELQEAPRLLAEDLGFLNAMDWGPDGYLYAPAMISGEILRIDVDTDPVTIETVADGFNNPSALKFNSQGELFVIGKRSGNLWQIDPQTGNRKLLYAFKPFILDNLAFNSQDRLFVSSSTEGWISEIKIKKRKVIARKIVKGGLVLPAGVAVVPGPKGRDMVFVADMAAVRMFNGKNGKQKDADYFCIGPAFWDSNYDGITHAITVAAADMERIVISSWVTGKVQVWNPIQKEIIEQHFFEGPINAAFFQDKLVVADIETGSIFRQTTSGFEEILTGLFVPTGLAAHENTLWVSDWASGVVWQISDTDAGMSPPIPVATGLNHPEGIAVDKNGNLLVVESGAQRLSRIDMQTFEVTAVKEDLDLGFEAFPYTPPTYAFNGVAVGGKGAIYVTGDTGRLLYRFKDKTRKGPK